MVRDVVENLKQPAREAVETVKDSATSRAQPVEASAHEARPSSGAPSLEDPASDGVV